MSDAPKAPSNCPVNVFLDTCVLDAHHYRFGSAQLAELAKVAKEKKLTLLLTGAMVEETTRHIRERAEAAISAVAKTRNDHPFVLRIPHWPEFKSKPYATSQLFSAVDTDWKAFKGNFQVKDLGVEGVDLKMVLRWYTWVRAPFGTGAKRKEFPDAFSISSLLKYAESSKTMVAVISNDNDMGSACRHHSELLHFPTVADFIALLLASDARTAAATALLDEQEGEICRRIADDFPDRLFYPAVDSDGDASDVKVIDASLTKVRLLALGHNEFMALFDADVTYYAYLSYDDPDSAIHVDGDVFPLHRRRGEVEDTASVSGIVRFSTDDKWSTVKEILRFEIEDDGIEVSGEAPIDDEEPDFNDIGD